MVFTVNLDAASGKQVTVDYAVDATSSASSGTDFTALPSGTLTFTAGQTSKTITVAVIGDELDEDNETVVLKLSNDNNASITTATASGTITDDDASPVLAAISNVNKKVGQAVSIVASATDADGDSLTYTWSKTSGPDLPNSTTLNSATLSFTPTATGTYAMTVTASDGNGNEASQSVSIIVTSADTVSVPSTLSVAENAGDAEVTISTTKAFGKSITFNLTYGGTSATGANAPADGDYDNDQTTSITFGTADTSKTISIPITDDSLDETNETFTVTIALANGSTLPSGIVLGNTTTTVTITDDDTLATSWSLSAAPNSVAEGSSTTEITVTATRSGTATDTTPTTVAIAVSGGTATAGTDFSEVTGFNVSVPAGATSGEATFNLAVTDDTTNEDDETISITGTLQGNSLSPATLTITDNDDDPALTIADATAVSEGDSGSTDMVFTVSLDAASDKQVTVDYAVDTTSTASSGTDFTALSSDTLTFTAGETSKSITVSVTGDELDENDETIVLKLSNASNATIGTATASGTITDDDASPVLAAISNMNKKVGQPVSIVASATDADGDTLTYTWSKTSGPDLPNGTTLNAATLTFTPTATGTYDMTVTANDGNGNEASEAVSIVVTAADTVSVPSNLTVAEGAGNAEVTISTTKAFGKSITFNVTYGGNSATGANAPADGDYDNNQTTSITFGTADTSKTISIPITDDSLDETNETFTVTIALANGSTLPSGIVLGNTTTTVTITDDDTLATSWSLSAAPNSVTEASGTTEITVTATRSGTATSTTPTTIAIAVADGTATAATDFSQVTGFNLSVPAGATSAEATFNLAVTDDSTAENDETITITGTLQGNSLTPATLSITDNDDDDDASPVLSAISNVNKKVGQAVSIVASATDADGDTVSYTWSKTSGPDLPDGTNLNAATLTFTPTETGIYAMTVTANDGNGNTDTEDVSIIVAAAASVSIPSSLSVAEGAGNAQVTVSITQAFGKSITFNVTYGGTSATGASDPANGDYDNDQITTVTFQSTNTSKTISIPITDDNLDESNETFTVNIALANGSTLPDGFVLGNATTTITITDDDTLSTNWTLTADPNSVAEDSGTTEITVSATRSGTATSTTPTTIAIAVAGGTATAATDFSQVTGFNLSIPAGATSGKATFDLVVTDDTTDEDDETISITGTLQGNSLSPATLTITDNDEATEDALQSEARKQALAGTSLTTLGIATDMIGSRVGGDLSGSGAGGSIGEQAWGIMENLLGYSSGSELSNNLSLEQVGERLWNQSFHIGQSDSQQEDWQVTGEQQGSWSLWGAGELRSFKGNDHSDTEQLSYSGSMKAAWLGSDYQVTDTWLAGMAVTFSSGKSDYSYQSAETATAGSGSTETQLTAFYPYGSMQLSEQLRLWGTVGFGFGELRHRTNDDNSTQEGQLKIQLATIGFEQQLSSIRAWELSLAGDLGIVKSSTVWQDNALLEDQDISITRSRLGLNSSLPLSETTTAYLNLKGRMDSGDVEMGAAEILLGIRYRTGRFSALLQGRQTYAFDGTYSESGILGELRFSSQQDGTGLVLELQPSYGNYGAVGAQQDNSLWNDQQINALTGQTTLSQQEDHIALKSMIGYGFQLQDSDLLLTPFTQLALTQGSRSLIELGLTMEAPLWEVTLTGSRNETASSPSTGNVKVMFSRQL